MSTTTYATLGGLVLVVVVDVVIPAGRELWLVSQVVVVVMWGEGGGGSVLQGEEIRTRRSGESG